MIIIILIIDAIFFSQIYSLFFSQKSFDTQSSFRNDQILIH